MSRTYQKEKARTRTPGSSRGEDKRAKKYAKNKLLEDEYLDAPDLEPFWNQVVDDEEEKDQPLVK